jgi:hypothetical protein
MEKNCGVGGFVTNHNDSCGRVLSGPAQYCPPMEVQTDLLTINSINNKPQ